MIGTVVVDEAFRFPDLDKSVTISGGSLDFSAYSTGKDMNLRDPMRFEGIALLFRENQIVMANGNKLYMDENVTMVNPIKLYGGTGSYGAVVDGTDMTVLGGQYAAIYGGSYQQQINGDVKAVGNIKVNELNAQKITCNNITDCYKIQAKTLECAGNITTATLTCDQIINNNNFLARLDRILMQFNCALSIFQLVFTGYGFSRQLTWLSGRNKGFV